MQRDILSENGLVLKEMASDASIRAKKVFADADSVVAFIADTFGEKKAMAIFYLDYGIRFAQWQGKQLLFAKDEENNENENVQKEPDPKFLQLARIFHKNRELKIWRLDEAFGSRLRKDSDGTGSYAVEARQGLWGTQARPAGKGWSRLHEERGTRLIIPIEIKDVPEGNTLPVAYVRTRNYIDFLDNGQATYIDSRFVEIEAEKFKK